MSIFIHLVQLIPLLLNLFHLMKFLFLSPMAYDQDIAMDLVDLLSTIFCIEQQYYNLYKPLDFLYINSGQQC